jgi:hypothetical protein
MQDDGNLVVYASDGKAIWASGTQISSKFIPFSEVEWVNGGSGVFLGPIILDGVGDRQLWSGVWPEYGYRYVILDSEIP